MIAALAIAFIVAQVALAAPAPLREQAPVHQTPAEMGIPAIPGIDATFAIAAMQGNNAELDMAQLALARSSAPEVTGFAQKMLAEHMELMNDINPALQRIVTAANSMQRNSAAAERLAAPDMLALAHLKTISDVDFDQVYALTQIADHLATLTAFRTEADNGTDPALKQIARRWIPTIEAHLQLALTLTRHIGGDSPFKPH